MLHQSLLIIFRQFVRAGEITIIVADKPGVTIRGPNTGAKIAIKLSDTATFWHIVRKPDLAIGEAYMNGTLQIVDDDLDGLMLFLMENLTHWKTSWPGRLSLFLYNRIAVFRHLNLPGMARKNVSHHYDLNDNLFCSFLDPRRQYSCAYFTAPDDDLIHAQNTKLARLAAKLNLQDGDRVLDVGCGWGGLAMAFVECVPGIDVTGITLSAEQLAYARRQVTQRQVDDRIDLALRDYRHQTGTFDKVVSVGMLEHVGPQNYGTYFAKISDVLSAKGVAVIHTIAVYAKAGPVNRWITKYIFPGGYLPSLEQLVHAAGTQQLKVLDVEIMRVHYAETLRAWRINFLTNIEQIKADYDQRFVRMWLYYLVGCEYFFRCQHGMVVQLQLAHDHMAAPMSRQYISELQDKFCDILTKTSPSGNASRSSK